MKRVAYPFLLIFAGLLLFFNTIFNGFAMDDKYQIVENSQVHSLNTIPSLFVSSLQVSNSMYFFKPLFYTAYSIIYTLSNGDPVAFHSIQIMLFITNVVLLYYLFCHFFSKKISFLLAFLFLIHPLNEEVMIYIANLQDVLFFFFGISSMLILTSKLSPPFKTVLSILFLLCSLLSKETGVLFIFISLLYLWLYKKSLFKYNLVASGVTIFFYFYRRIIAGSSPSVLESINYPIKHIPLAERMTIVPKIMFSYIKDIFLPNPILPDIKWLERPSVIESIIPTVCILAFTILLGMTGYLIWSKNRKLIKVYVFFFTWFIIGILFHSQIIPLDVIIAKRWMYFSLVGALGILGTVMEVFKEIIQSKKDKKVFIILYTVYTIILIMQVLLMNSVWAKLK
jgi:protein O-mannosyl-transferase